MLVNIKVDSDVLVEVLVNRLKEMWTKDPIAIKLYEDMYQSYCDGGCFDGGEFDPSLIVDNDWVNYCNILEPNEEFYNEVLNHYNTDGLGDCSCDNCGYSYIENRYQLEDGTYVFLCRW